MPNFLALRCAECGKFQVQQQTKKAKFRCPVCGICQSVLKVYATATQAKPIRAVVATLNRREGELALQSYRQAESLDATPKGSASEFHGTANDGEAQTSNMWDAFAPQENRSSQVAAPSDAGFTTMLPCHSKRRAKRGPLDYSPRKTRREKSRKSAGALEVQCHNHEQWQVHSWAPGSEALGLSAVGKVDGCGPLNCVQECIPTSQHDPYGRGVSFTALQSKVGLGDSSGSAKPGEERAWNDRVQAAAKADESQSCSACKSFNTWNIFCSNADDTNCGQGTARAVIGTGGNGSWHRPSGASHGLDSEVRIEHELEDVQDGLFVTAL
jgi:uncharacterized Zn finger protein (UPF0148 family)